ncbi:hypothetical protein HU200_036193 [Digitaria exilis]|uniref:Uncharacterized protein n=1 Tax=Digitaria exilis TaxID=1010633 RepID=A0A835BGQ2_9POAL|nr:hypothetical protein HU200_036193 [Digitaria exilis]
MDMGFYKRARGIVVKHNSNPRKPAAAPVQQQPAGSRAKQQPAATTTMWSPPPPSAVVAMEVIGGGNTGVAPGGGSDADVDRRAALYICRVQERLRRERMLLPAGLHKNTPFQHQNYW